MARRPKLVPVGTLVELPDPGPEPWERVAAAEEERRPIYLVGLLCWTANPAQAVGYRGGICPHCRGRRVPRGAACVICSATATSPRGVPMQRIRAARAKKAANRKERRAAGVWGE